MCKDEKEKAPHLEKVDDSATYARKNAKRSNKICLLDSVPSNWNASVETGRKGSYGI